MNIKRKTKEGKDNSKISCLLELPQTNALIEAYFYCLRQLFTNAILLKQELGSAAKLVKTKSRMGYCQSTSTFNMFPRITISDNKNYEYVKDSRFSIRIKSGINITSMAEKNLS